MLKEIAFWVGLPCLVAVGSAALVWMLMQARIQLLATNYKAAIAEVEKVAAESRPRLEDLLAELRLERRQFLRKTSGVRGSETTILTLERLYFRQIPLTGWMQEEIPLGGGRRYQDRRFFTRRYRQVAGSAQCRWCRASPHFSHPFYCGAR